MSKHDLTRILMPRKSIEVPNILAQSVKILIVCVCQTNASKSEARLE